MTTNTQSIDKVLLAAGFTVPPDKAIPRMIVALDGPQKTGKSFFSLTAPDPIAIINTDVGLEGVVERFKAAGKKIYDFQVPVPDTTSMKRDEVLVAADAAWDKLVKAHRAALQVARTVVWDNATEVNELVRLAHFGRLEQVKPHHYAAPNTAYRKLVREAYDRGSGVNFILIHKQKKTYVDKHDKGEAVWNGAYERAGLSDMGYLIQANLVTSRLPIKDRDEGDLGFQCEVVDCRQNARVQGEILSGEMFHFAHLGIMVFPESDLVEDWGWDEDKIPQ